MSKKETTTQVPESVLEDDPWYYNLIPIAVIAVLLLMGFGIGYSKAEHDQRRDAEAAQREAKKLARQKRLNNLEDRVDRLEGKTNINGGTVHLYINGQ